MSAHEVAYLLGHCTLCQEKRWNIEAQSLPLAKELQCPRTSAGLFPALPGAGFRIDHSDQCVAGVLLVFVSVAGEAPQ